MCPLAPNCGSQISSLLPNKLLLVLHRAPLSGHINIKCLIMAGWKFRSHLQQGWQNTHHPRFCSCAFISQKLTEYSKCQALDPVRGPSSGQGRQAPHHAPRVRAPWHRCSTRGRLGTARCSPLLHSVMISMCHRSSPRCPLPEDRGLAFWHGA